MHDLAMYFEEEDPDHEVTDDPQVRLHVYDVGTASSVRRANKLFRKLGTGAFHAGVEVYGGEYSFGACDEGTGVFVCRPKGCEGHHYREALGMGPTSKTMHEVVDILQDVSRRWQGCEYDLLRHNCTHFCQDFLEELEVAEMPPWVLNLAAAGATLSDRYRRARNRAHMLKIITAAKAGAIDEKFQVKAKFQKVKLPIERSCRNCRDAMVLAPLRAC